MSSSWQPIYQTSSWQIYTTSDFWNQHSLQIIHFAPFLDVIVQQLTKDFGYKLPLSTGQNKYHLVLDPTSHGGATGTPFGTLGITIAADSLYNQYQGISGFWFYLLALHETINIWTGYVTAGWPWANGSNIWRGGSQFPNAADTIVLQEVGLQAISQLQNQRMANQPDVQLLVSLQRQYSWKIYQDLFNLIRLFGLDLASLSEPLKTGVILYFLSLSANTDLRSRFAQAGIIIPNTVFNVVASYLANILKMRFIGSIR